MTSLLPTYARSPVAFERGEGVRLFTGKGDAYLDFAGGIAVNLLGHAHPHLVAALTEQAGKVWHVSNIFTIPGGERLADRLCAATFADRVFFTNSGAEAVECAIKTARKYHAVAGHPERYRLITFEGAFHGRTLATIAAGGQAKYLEGFGPRVEGFDQVSGFDMEQVKAAFGPQTAGVLIEPVQGEGGIRVVPDEFLRALRAFCDEKGILLVLDEIQCGMGRTGRLFAHEWAGITPDIMAIAKGIGGGFPLGACLATEEAAKGMTTGTHGSTYGGNPLAMAVGNAVLDIILEPGFLERVRDAGARIKQGLAGLVDTHPQVFRGIRGRGLMVGLECVVPNTEVVAAARERRLLSVGAGDNVVRLLPPLIVTDADIAEALSVLDGVAVSFEERGQSKAS
ncbi:MAG: aspartate aminotransferase family protein [Flavobacteriaceae bacterium]